MPIVTDGDDISISWTFRYEAFLCVEHPRLDAEAINGALALPGESGSIWRYRLENDLALSECLLAFIARVAPAAEFLGRVRAEGGRCLLLVIVFVDYNAWPVFGAEVCRRAGELGIDLAVHALTAESPESK